MRRQVYCIKDILSDKKQYTQYKIHFTYTKYKTHITTYRQYNMHNNTQTHTHKHESTHLKTADECTPEILRNRKSVNPENWHQD